MSDNKQELRKKFQALKETTVITPSPYLEGKRLTDIGAPASLAAFFLGVALLATESAPVPVGVLLVGSAMGAVFIPMLAAGLSTLSAISGTVRVFTTGNAREKDSADVKELRQEFKKAAAGYGAKHALCAVMMLATAIGFSAFTADFPNSANAGGLGMAVVGSIVGCAAGLGAYRSGMKMKIYDAAMKKAGSTPNPT